MTQYRFWGSEDPRGRTKLPLLGAVPQLDTQPYTLQVYEPIDSWGGVWGISASEFAEALRAVPDAADLTLRINSPGGEVSEAVAIGSMLAARSGSLQVRVDGWACSCASYLAVLGETVTMGPDSMLMIHKPWGLAIGNDDDMYATGDLLAKVGGQLARAYAAKSGAEPAAMLAAMAAETWYTADEAVVAGLADSVLGAEPADDELPVAAAARWQLWAGRAPAAPDPAPAPAPDPAPAPPAAAPKVPADAFAGILDALKGATV